MKVSESERSIKWADDSLATLYRWLPITANPGVVEFFREGDITQVDLRTKFVELTWPSSQQEQWQAALDLLSRNLPKILEWERQKQELMANTVAPATDLNDAVRLANEESNARVRAEADFDAFSNVLGKLKAMGSEIVHSHEDAHCPLCNHDWGTAEKLRIEISTGQQLLAPALEIAANNLTVARQKEQEATAKLALNNAQKQAYDSHLSRLSSVVQELKSFATKTKYLETMQVRDFSGLNAVGLAHLSNRITSAIQLGLVLKSWLRWRRFSTIPLKAELAAGYRRQSHVL